MKFSKPLIEVQFILCILLSFFGESTCFLYHHFPFCNWMVEWVSKPFLHFDFKKRWRLTINKTQKPKRSFCDFILTASQHTEWERAYYSTYIYNLYIHTYEYICIFINVKRADFYSTAKIESRPTKHICNSTKWFLWRNCAQGNFNFLIIFNSSGNNILPKYILHLKWTNALASGLILGFSYSGILLVLMLYLFFSFTFALVTIFIRVLFIILVILSSYQLFIHCLKIPTCFVHLNFGLFHMSKSMHIHHRAHIIIHTYWRCEIELHNNGRDIRFKFQSIIN